MEQDVDAAGEDLVSQSKLEEAIRIIAPVLVIADAYRTTYRKALNLARVPVAPSKRFEGRKRGNY